MEKRTREIIALALLVVLGLGGLSAGLWYLIAGHGWNVTASNIDDSIGQMEGYKVFLFEGTRKEPLEPDRTAQKKPIESGGIDPSAAAADQEPSTEAPTSQSAPSVQEEAQAAPSPAEAAATATSTATAKATQVQREAWFSSVVDSYRDKGASVFLLDLEDLALYEEPQVFMKGGFRVGVFFVGTPARRAEARVDVKLLQRQEAHFVVGITSDPSLLNADVPGVDLLLCTTGDGAPGSVDTQGSAFGVYAPYLGDAEAVIVSPSGVISTKVLEFEPDAEDE